MALQFRLCLHTDPVSLNSVDMTSTTEAVVRVDLGNDVSQESVDVQFALSGLAYIAAGLIAIGETGIITEDKSQQMAGWESFAAVANATLSDHTKSRRLESQCPGMEELVDATDRAQLSDAFEYYLNRLVDPMFSLVQVPDDPHHYTFTMMGW
ncbi:MAG: hypothetical protein JWS12_506 [Candidatus Saccharibacteria bacterium]|nr:hypothetical protein [Candidatus Saccharibacteria bacterium]